MLTCASSLPIYQIYIHILTCSKNSVVPTFVKEILRIKPRLIHVGIRQTCPCLLFIYKPCFQGGIKMFQWTFFWFNALTRLVIVVICSNKKELNVDTELNCMRVSDTIFWLICILCVHDLFFYSTVKFTNKFTNKWSLVSYTIPQWQFW